MGADFDSTKRAAMHGALVAVAADYIDRLIGQVQQKVPPSQTFTRDELVELLRGVAQGMRNGR